MNHNKYIDLLLELLLEGAESEVERLMKTILPDSPFAGLVHAVGGYVRDQYISMIKNDPSIEAKDLDIVVDMKGGAEKFAQYIYDQFSDITPNPISTPRNLGEDYPIWKITFKDNVVYNGEMYKTGGAEIDIADAMKETFPDPKSRQRKVEPAEIKDDVERRDFTVNMLMRDLTTGEMEDMTGISKEDIKKGVLRGHPAVSLDTMFSNDPLRMLRLLRFQAKYGWNIPLSVLKAVKRNAERIQIVSSERIMGELKKVMEYGKLATVIQLMSTTGLLKYVLPEIDALKGVQQNKEHHREGDVYTHTLMVLKNTPPGVENQMAALLHDIGKKETTEMISDKITSYGHDDVGADIAKAIMHRLKFDNTTTDKVVSMVKNHMRPHFLSRNPSPKSIRKFIRDVGDDMVYSILTLAHADELGRIPSSEHIPDLIKSIDMMKREAPATKKSVLNGNEIMELLDIRPGKEVRQAVEYLQELEDEHGSITKEFAKKELLKKFKK